MVIVDSFRIEVNHRMCRAKSYPLDVAKMLAVLLESTSAYLDFHFPLENIEGEEWIVRGAQLLFSTFFIEVIH